MNRRENRITSVVIPVQTEARFRRLVEEWQRATEHTSSIMKAIMHPAYLQIIGMGEQAVPLLLRELHDNSGHWFIALHSIKPDDDPTEPGDNFDVAASKWLPGEELTTT
ncbi:MAG TPA: hypothetical protein VFC63_15670 [Blastocatellia bacterium]|nr:hypothetical protein [Blastocatellia bacterium]